MNSFTYFIAAPFGNYLKFSNKKRYQNCVSVTGTWTLSSRAGWMKKIWRVATTLRYDFKLNGWTNQLGLPNSGLKDGLLKTRNNEVLSIAALEKDDWIGMQKMISDDVSLEINLSCPNVDHTEVVWKDLQLFVDSKKRKWCIAKVSPLIIKEQLQFLIDEIGFTQIHLCNTLPIDGKGGLSGPTLRPYVFEFIDYIRNRWGDELELIAGGGIQKIEDVNNYISAGANHVSLGTICFKPWKLNNLVKK